jgi:hypothetical protein
LFSGIADVCEWFDESIGKFRIEVNVTNRVWGPLFKYRGTFDALWKSVAPGEIPAGVKPVREQRRE